MLLVMGLALSSACPGLSMAAYTLIGQTTAPAELMGIAMGHALLCPAGRWLQRDALAWPGSDEGGRGGP